MKKLIIFLLLLPALAWGGDIEIARMNPYILGGGVAPAASVAYCTDCTHDGDNNTVLVCEDFEGASECENDASPDEANVCRCANGWTVVENSNTYVFDATAASGYPCTSTTNTHVLEATKSGTNDLQYASKTWTDTNNVYIQFYMRVASVESGTNTVIAALLGDGDADARIYLQEGSGVPTLYMAYHNGTSTTTGSSTEISLNTWYRVRWAWNKNTGEAGSENGVVLFQLNDTTVTNVTNNASTNDADTFRFGNMGSDTDEYSIQYDNLMIKSDVMPGACE